MNPEPLLERNSLKVQSWIKACVDGHASCSVESEEMPTRLVDVGESDSSELKLVLLSTRVRYGALSHCWGGGKPRSTTRANKEARRIKLSLTGLPRTFKDVVTLTQWLGLQYLWIDSLCILQDGTRDWEVESVKMGAIYSGSFLVISATKEESSDDGFLGLRGGSIPTMSTNFRGGNLAINVIRRIGHNWRGKSSPPQGKDCRLANRGWVFQERLLAARVPYFTPSELVRRCRTKTICECGEEEAERAGFDEAPFDHSAQGFKHSGLVGIPEAQNRGFLGL